MHTLSGYTLFTQCSFDSTKDMLDSYRGKECMERFCKNLKEHATKIINYEKKEMIPLTGKKFVIYAKKDLGLVMTVKNIIKWKIIVITQENIGELLMIFAI